MQFSFNFLQLLPNCIKLTMVTSRFRFSHDVLVHLKKGTDTSDLLNFNIDPPLSPKNPKNAILGPKMLKNASKMATFQFLGQRGQSILKLRRSEVPVPIMRCTRTSCENLNQLITIVSLIQFGKNGKK